MYNEKYINMTAPHILYFCNNSGGLTKVKYQEFILFLFSNSVSIKRDIIYTRTLIDNNIILYIFDCEKSTFQGPS